MMEWMRKALLRLRNRGQIEVEVNLTKQSPKMETKHGDHRTTTNKRQKERKQLEIELAQEEAKIRAQKRKLV